MAKSSLTFSERRKVLVLGSSADHVTRTLTKQDCGKVIVLTNLQGHVITLPTAVEAGEGWNCRFIVGTAHNDRSVRDSSSIAAQGSEVLTLVTSKNGGSQTTGTAATTTNMFDTGRNAGIKARDDNQGQLTAENFTITVPTSVGGTGTTFTFKFVMTANLTAGNSAAGEFEIDVEAIANDNAIAAQIIAIINGAAIGAGTRVPASGEGSTGTGITGLTAAAGGAGDQVSLTADNVGENAISVAMVGGHAGATAKIFGAADNALVGTSGTARTAGVNRTSFLLSTRTVLVTEGAAEGDKVDIAVVNGEWQANSVSSL